MFLSIDSLVIYYHQGADPASTLNIVPNVPPDLYVRLNWQPDDANTGRTMESLTRSDIQAAYLRAWLQWNLSLLKKAPYGLETYFVGPALADLNSEIYAVTKNGWLLEQADMTHSLQLHFYSADGSIVSFTDSDATVVRLIHDKNGNVIFTNETTAVYQVIMILADGNWRVRHWVQTANQPLDKMTSPLHTPPGFIGKDKNGPSLILYGQPYHIAGINYYPQSTPWDRFWTRYNTRAIDYDFSNIQSLRLNTVRIFIPFDQFGGPDLGMSSEQSSTTAQPSSKQNEIVQKPMEKLADLLERASRHNLHVIITLFDFHTDYTLLHWPDADRQLETLLTHFKNNASILAWDLKNEPDLDYHTSETYRVNAWLTHIAYFARRYDPHHLLTIGWSSPDAAHTRIPIVDFVSFHYYASPASLASAYSSLRATFPEQPIILGEFGLPTWNSFFFPNGHTEAEQAVYYADTLRFLRSSDSSGYLSWTLYDFDYIPSHVAGSWPWQVGPQKAMGVLHSNGNPKLAFHLLAPDAMLDVPPIPRWQFMVKPFWITVIVSILFSIGLSVFVQKRLKLKKTSE